MELYESAEDYLESILIIGQQKGSVRAIDVAKDLGFSKASVSVAMHKLEDNGYIIIHSNGEIELTKEGSGIAASVYERHVVLTDLFIKLGVDQNQARRDACKIEHDLSKETFAAIKKAINKYYEK